MLVELSCILLLHGLDVGGVGDDADRLAEGSFDFGHGLDRRLASFDNFGRHMVVGFLADSGELDVVELGDIGGTSRKGVSRAA